MNNDIEYQDISDVNVLIRFFPQIKALFAKCFARVLSQELWAWAYLDNPCGTPLVSLAIVDGKVVGHYAVIPQRLVNKFGGIKGYLAMTTMVAPEFRRFGLFKILAERVYRIIDADATPGIVYGFPNNNAISGCRKRLGWTIASEYKMVRVLPDDWYRWCSIIKNSINEWAYCLNMANSDIHAWRCNKPGQSWVIQNGLGLKEMGDAFDIMYYASPDALLNPKMNRPANILVPFVTTKDTIDSTDNILFSYRFGYRAFNIVDEPSFNIQMCMSDVF